MARTTATSLCMHKCWVRCWVTLFIFFNLFVFGINAWYEERTLPDLPQVHLQEVVARWLLNSKWQSKLLWWRLAKNRQHTANFFSRIKDFPDILGRLILQLISLIHYFFKYIWKWKPWSEKIIRQYIVRFCPAPTRAISTRPPRKFRDCLYGRRHGTFSRTNVKRDLAMPVYISYLFRSVYMEIILSGILTWKSWYISNA